MLVSRSCIALVLAVAACSYGSAGELSASECSDTEDNDHDDLKNCEDPDCLAHAHCAAHSAKPIGDSSAPRPIRDAQVPEPADSSALPPADSAAPVDEDGGEPEPVAPDAGDPPCDGLCDPTLCVDDMCRDPRAPAGGAFELRILAVEVPDFDESGMCLDACIESLLPPFGFCACAPDPFVVIWRVQGEGDQSVRTQLGATPVASNERSPNFMDHPIPIELMEGDALELVVMDDDPGPGPSAAVYACRPNLSALTFGPLECSVRVVAFLPPYSISAELRQLP